LESNRNFILVIVGVIVFAALANRCGSEAEPPAAVPETEKSSSPDTAAAKAGDKLWVTSKRLERRSCPSEACGVVGEYFFREAADVFERKGGWARVTRPYAAACENGKSPDVERGNSACSPENGIRNGELAEWVLAEHLSSMRPPDPAESAASGEQLVAQSDDFAEHRAAFARAAGKLISDGKCTAADFKEMGGWVKSTTHRNEPVYFTYCGGMTISNRIYLNAGNGRVFQ
jgi:hypothetical protein